MPLPTRKTMLLATDQQQSVLNTLDGNGRRSIAYTPYGHRSRENGLLSLLGFNGEPPDALTGHYHLGNRYRQFNPVLMRFNSPDSWSPFGDGGLNAYAYCGGDPRNRTDPTGHILGIGTALAKYGLGWKAMRPKISPTSKKVVMSHISSAKSGPPPSTPAKSADIDINAFTQREIDAEAAALKKFGLANKRNMPAPSATQGASHQPRSNLMNRRTKSLGQIPDSLDDMEAFYASKRNDPVSDFVISQFTTDLTGTHAKLYWAMNSELKTPPNAQVQRTIRTGGRK